MRNFNVISNLEGDLRAAISLDPVDSNVHSIDASVDTIAAGVAGSDGVDEASPTAPKEWVMRVHLFYKGESVGVTCFNLHGYSQKEAESTAKNLKKNAYLMREIDEFLWGESE